MAATALILETSFAPFQVLLAQEDRILFHSNEHEWQDNRRNIAQMLTKGLNVVGQNIEDISQVFVNTGPGSTNAIRSGVSFANGLAFSLNIPVIPYTSFELMGYEVQTALQLPVLCTAKAINGNVYAAWYEGQQVHARQYGRLKEVVEAIVPNTDQPFAVAGIRRDEVLALFSSNRIEDSKTERIDAQYLVNISDRILTRQVLPPAFVSPLNEQSKLFQTA
ncbi:MAG: tRNA (adenosine(37)-N6)-threonylcarbamoyltransferase complex dimerization subunit type 1 TsaB [Bacteroidota bacterium]